MYVHTRYSLPVREAKNPETFDERGLTVKGTKKKFKKVTKVHREVFEVGIRSLLA
jgi:hypothetical protein